MRQNSEIEFQADAFRDTVQDRVVKTGLLAGLTLAMVVATSGAAFAAKLEVGSLACTAGASGGVIVMTEQKLDCVFQPSDGSEPQQYVGEVRKFGLDIGVTGGTQIQWLVLADEADWDPAALGGNYVGVSADASLGIGAGVNVLLGGTDGSIVLQPVSVQEEVGLDIAVGITDLQLTPA